MTPKQKLQHATEMAEFWQYRGNRAAERGNDDLAERHYAKSQKYRDEITSFQNCNHAIPDSLQADNRSSDLRR